MKFTNISGHAQDLADGSVVGAAEECDLTSREIAEEPHNRMLIAEGLLYAHTKRGQEVIDEAQAELEKEEAARREAAVASQEGGNA